MTLPELDDFRRRIETLRQHSALKPWMDGDRVALGGLTLPQIVGLLADDAGYYFLIAAAGLNRTTLRRGMSDPEAQVVAPVQRRAYVVRTTLPTTGSFDAVASSAVSPNRHWLAHLCTGRGRTLPAWCRGVRRPDFLPGRDRRVHIVHSRHHHRFELTLMGGG